MPSDKGRRIVRNSSSCSFSCAWDFFWSFSSPCCGVRASVQKKVKKRQRRTYHQSHTRTAQLPEVSRIIRHSDFMDSSKIAASGSNQICFLRTDLTELTQQKLDIEIQPLKRGHLSLASVEMFFISILTTISPSPFLLWLVQFPFAVWEVTTTSFKVSAVLSENVW